MINLAGDTTCDRAIKQELELAGIRLVGHEQPLRQEVPASITGVLTLNGVEVFSFVRAWYYWVVKGDVPLEVAQEMFDNPVGKEDVRVAGYAGNSDPKNWAFPHIDVVTTYLLVHCLDGVTYGRLAELCNSGEIDGPRFVESYHIDSQAGLDYFVATLRGHGLAD